LHSGKEVGLTPASFAIHAVGATTDVVARRIVQPEILEEWSLWFGLPETNPLQFKAFSMPSDAALLRMAG
jgi:hypothetical protein